MVWGNQAVKMTRFRAGKNFPHKRPDATGFSLVEMMIVVLLIGIISTVAAPGMFRYLQSTRLQTNTDQLAADLQYARSAAVAKGMILQFASTETGYILSIPANGTILKSRNFDDGLQLAVAQNTFFFPWGMADATIYTMSGHGQSRQINVLPTGIVEVP